MLKFFRNYASITLVLILVGLCCRTFGSQYKTQVKFYHEQIFPRDHYWVVIATEYQDQNAQTVMNQLQQDLRVLKQILEKEGISKNDSLVSSLQQNEGIKLILGSESQSQAFADTLSKKFDSIKSYKIVLDSLNIHLMNPFSVQQNIYICLQNKNRQQLIKIVDSIQSQFDSSENLKIVSIEKGNLNSYMPFKGSQLYFQNIAQLIDQSKLTQKITTQAQKYCHTLNMEFIQLLSFDPIVQNQEINSNSTQGQLFDQTKQMTYGQAYQLTYKHEHYDYENIFYQVKAVCKGQKIPRKSFKKQVKSIKKPFKKQRKYINTDKINKQLNKLNEKIKNKKLI